MGKREITAIVIGIILLIGVNFLYSYEKNPHKCEVDTVYVKVYVDTGNIYNEAIDHLKEYEGFRSKMYYDTDGSKTIGYGHHFKPGEDFKTITEEEATDILKDDLATKIDHVSNITDTLTSNQELALGLFAFNVGTGNLDKAISRGLLTNITSITDYCHYKVKKDGQQIVKRSKKLYERRLFELYVFNK